MTRIRGQKDFTIYGDVLSADSALDVPNFLELKQWKNSHHHKNATNW